MGLKKPSVSEPLRAPAQEAPQAEPQATVSDHSAEFSEDEAAEQATPLAPIGHATPGTAVAAPAQNTGVMAPTAPNTDGFDDLDQDIGYGSFPILKLDKDLFVFGDVSLDHVDVEIQTVRKKFVHKISRDKDNERLSYSYDNVHTTTGIPLVKKYEEWRAELSVPHAQPEISRYMECMVRVIGASAKGKPTEEHNNKQLLLSIPQASISRLAGYKATLQGMQQKRLSDVVTRCKKGPLVKISPKISFYPWDFEDVSAEYPHVFEA